MIDPRKFYRKMDRLLARIASEGPTVDFLQHILDELVASFGPELHFGNGHLYHELFGVFELLHATGDSGIFPARLDDQDAAVNRVLEYGAYVYESASDVPEWFKPKPDDCDEFVAIRLDGPPGYRYLVLFTLSPGWVRDEIRFCLNGFRFSLNFRLKAEAAENELETAATIQRSLLPQNPPAFEGWDIAARSQPAEAVGGDLYDFIELESDLLGVAIGDASGHGLPAALLVRDVLMGIRMGVGTNLKMLYTMKKLNRVLHKTTFSTRFISVFYCELQRHGGILYTNAGHTSGLIIAGDTVSELEPTGTIMGPLPDIPLERAYAQVPPGAMLVLYTDGITERVEKDGSPFDTPGLIKCLKTHANLPAADVVDRVFDHALSLEHESDMLEDDSTLLVLKYVN